MRLDLRLYQNGYTDSRQKAKNLIENGSVYVNGKQITKASFDVFENAQIEIRGEVMPYVGRGGYKLAGALDAFCVVPTDFVCVDIGSSTGGFTDCLLQRGAKRVYAVDSGTDQLAASLRTDARVVVMERFNARDLSSEVIGELADLCVCDVSFISLTHIFPPVARLLKPYDKQSGAGIFVALIKPQFEAGREHIGKGGIVRDKRVYMRVIADLIEAARASRLYCTAVIPSPILGGDGNREFLAQFVFDAPDAENRSLSDRKCIQNIIDS
ncbi:MAG: TlyA family RNA methyltransferase [Clostridia bacterium]|nr:TlyA family RNA methyltransferase [Clostridia bacterium]